MNKNQIEGKAKDVGGRVERQVGEWTGDAKMQVRGTAKQVEGKAQNVVGKIEEAAKKVKHEAKASENSDKVHTMKTPRDVEQEQLEMEDEVHSSRRAGR